MSMVHLKQMKKGTTQNRGSDIHVGMDTVREVGQAFVGAKLKVVERRWKEVIEWKSKLSQVE
jgi:hypothetical protein